MKKIARHIPHYFSLIGLMAVAVFGLVMFEYDQGFQAAIAVSLSFGYFVWGVIHHMIHKDLYFVVVLEYLSVSILGLVVILSLIYR